MFIQKQKCWGYFFLMWFYYQICFLKFPWCVKILGKTFKSSRQKEGKCKSMVMKINWALNWILNSLNQIKLLFLDFICSRNCGFVFFSATEQCLLVCDCCLFVVNEAKIEINSTNHLQQKQLKLKAKTKRTRLYDI